MTALTSTLPAHLADFLGSEFLSFWNPQHLSNSRTGGLHLLACTRWDKPGPLSDHDPLPLPAASHPPRQTRTKSPRTSAGRSSPSLPGAQALHAPGKCGSQTSFTATHRILFRVPSPARFTQTKIRVVFKLCSELILDFQKSCRKTAQDFRTAPAVVRKRVPPQNS